MRQITEKVMKVLLAVIMCFSVLHIPYLGTEVFAEEGDEIIEEITERTQSTVFTAELDEVTVTATVAEGTFAQEVELVVDPISVGSEEYRKTEDILKDSGAEYDGMIAYDIYFKVVETGEKIEPDGSVDVQISLNEDALTEIAPEIDVETINVTHITEEEEVEVVAEDFEKVEGAAEALEVKFTVESFSTFAITWKEGEGEEQVTKTATVIWGEIGTDGTIDPFDVENVSIDTSAGSVSLDNIFDGYEFAQAHYEKGETNVVVDPVLYNDNGVYKLKMHIHDGDSTSVVLTPIEDGSTIYVGYVPKGEPHDPSPEEVEGPTTIKNVVDNHDGTSSIILDVKGAVKTETEVTGANVLIVLDRTKSMRYNMGNDQIADDERDNRWTVAREAIDLLVTTLSTGENAGNDVEYSLISFYNRIDSPIHTWGTDEWTNNATTYNAYIQGDSLTPIGPNDNTNNGTNWEDPLYRALLLAQAKNQAENNKDKTYVIFVTDGSPNARGTGETGNNYTGYVRNGQTAAVNAARPHAVSLYSDSNIEFYGVFCGASAGGYDTLDGMLTAAASTAGKTDRPATIDGADDAAIKAAFANIASTIVNNFGSTNTTVDDGVTSLSNVSAMVSGEAGGFEYYKTSTYDEETGEPINFTKWENPAGASYSEDNGVTWNLSEVGTLEDGVTYRLVFKVWPSQEAYDLIADFNNEVKKITDTAINDETREQLKIITNGSTYVFETGKGWTAGGSSYLTNAELQRLIDSNGAEYYLKTNTHLRTTYTYNGQTYTDEGITQTEGQMHLESETMNVKKDWVDDINDRNRANKVEFYLKVGDKYYTDASGNKYALIVKDKKLLSSDSAADEGGQKPAEYFVTNGLEWTEEVEIAPGIVQFDVNGNATVLETGHSYQLEEGKSWTYEFTKTTGEGGTYYTVVAGSEEEASGYSMEFQSEIVRPMVLTDTAMGGSYSGTLVYLVEKSSVYDESRLLNSNVYTINDVEYCVLADETHLANASVSGFNFKTAELDITKIIDSSLSNKTAAELDEETFTFEVTFVVPEAAVNDVSGINYWIYTPTTEGDTWTLPEYSGTNPGAAFAPTGYSADETWGGTKYPTTASGTTVTATVTMNRNQVIRFTNLPTGTTYTIVEVQANGKDLTSQGYLVKNTSTNGTAGKETVDNDKITGTIAEPNTRYYNRFENKLDAVDAEIKVTKAISGREWTDADSFTLTLVASETTNPMPDTTEVTATTSAKTNTYGQLRFIAAGTYTYTITEANGGTVVGDLTYAANPAATIVVTVSTDENGKLYVSSITGGTFTEAGDGKPASVEATVTNTYETTTVTVTKEWSGADANNLPESISVQLKVGDTVKDTQTLTAENNWTYTWTGLQANENGAAIAYTVDEPTVPDGYTKTVGTVSGSIAEGYKVTITNTRDKATLKLVKVVSGNVTVPADTTFTVTGPADFGTKTVKYSEMTSNTYDFGEVPTGDYTVTETGAGIEGYTLVTTTSTDTAALTLEKGDEGELTVTNTYTRDQAGLVLKKVVVGDVTVPSTTTFTVTGPADFGTSGSMTVSYSDFTNGSYDFGQVPTGTYSVTEDGAGIEGYTLTTAISDPTEVTLEQSGELTVTNTYVRDTAKLVLKKVVEGDTTTPGTATFTVTGPDDFGTNGSMTVSYSDFTDGSYDFGQVPTGQYSVTESGAEVTGYSLTTTISDPVTLEKNGEGTLTVTNKYTINTYDVTVTKIFDIEDLDKIPANFAIDITIGTNTDTLTLKDEDVEVSTDGTTYTWTLKDVPYGSVIGAEEKNYEVEGFTWTGTATTASVTVSTDSEKNVITLTNPYTRNNYDLTVTKVFDIDDAEKIPAGFEIDLTYGETTKALKLTDEGVTVSEDKKTYTWKVEAIPYETEVAWEEKGYEITGFTWKGTAKDGKITISATESANVLTVSNPYERKVYSVNVVKIFYIDDYSKITADFYIAYSIDGEAQPNLTLENAQKVGENEFHWVIENVPFESLIELDEKNYEIPGYRLVSAMFHSSDIIIEDGVTIGFYNVYERQSYEITVTKEFTGITNEMIPEDFQISITVDGKEIQVLKVTDEDVKVDGLKYTWILSEKIPYETEITATESGYEIFGATLSEDAVTEVTLTVDVEDNVMELTNPYTIDTFSVIVNKIWEDNNDQDGFRAKLGATVQLYKQLEGSEEKTKVGDPVTVGTGDDWSNEWKDLPAYEDGKLVTYSVEETYGDETLNYTMTIGDPVQYTGEVSETIEVTNAHEPEQIDIPVEKVWKGDEDFDVRPESVTVELLADGKSIGEEGLTAELNEENEWKFTFEGLDQYADGKEIEYTVKEVEVPAGYKSEAEGDNKGWTITNTFTPIHFDPPVMKVVEGDEADSDDTFTFQFEGLDGAPMPEGAEGQVMTATLKAGEEHEFGDVYLVEPGTYQYKITEVNEGKEGYAYDETEYLLVFEITVDEDNQLAVKLTINGEEADYQNLTPSQFKFVNEYRDYIDVEVEKIWEDNDDEQGLRPEELEVTLYANGEAVETVTLSEENGWAYKWEGLEFSDENFEEISYTVKEDNVPEGYTMSFSQTGNKVTITNTVNPPETGDTNNMKLWATLMALSMTSSVALAGVALKRRKEEELF